MRGQHLVEARHDLGEHRQAGHERARAAGGVCDGAARPRQGGDCGEVAQQEGRAAHRLAVHRPRGADRLQHEAVGHAGSHLAADDASEKLPLLVGGSARELGETRFARAARACADRVGGGCKGIGDVAERERRFPRPGSGRRQGANAEHSWIGGRKRPAREKRHSGRHLVGPEDAEKCGDEAELVESTSARLEPAAQGREFRKCRHTLIVENRSPVDFTDGTAIRSWHASCPL